MAKVLWVVAVAVAVVALLSKLCAVPLTTFATKLIDRRWPPSESFFLQGAFGPVEQPTAPTALRVLSGKVPADLRGVFLRIGPNPQFLPPGNHHRFDGDGVVHAITFAGGEAQMPIYSSDLFETHRVRHERAAGRSLFLNLGELVGGRGMSLMILDGIKMMLLGVIPKLPSFEDGVANTAFGWGHGKLYGCYESNRPFEFKISPSGAISSVGFESFKDSLQSGFTAHPKTDDRSGEMHFIHYGTSPGAAPLGYGFVGADGKVSHPRTFAMDRPTMFHDFAMSEQHLMVVQAPLQFDGPAMLKSENGWPIQFRDEERVRIGVWRKGPQPAAEQGDGMIWVDVGPAFMSFHTMSAWDDGEDAVVVTAVRTPSFKMDYDHNTVNDRTHLWQWRVDLKNQSVTWARPVYEKPCEFPTINMRFMGRRHRFGYVAMFGPEGLGIGVAKVDLEAGRPVAEILWQDRHQNTDTVFAPRAGSSDAAEDEDDGFLVALTTAKEGSGFASRALIYDARTMDPEPLAVLALPRHVPHGLHASFIDDRVIDAHYRRHAAQ